MNDKRLNEIVLAESVKSRVTDIHINKLLDGCSVCAHSLVPCVSGPKLANSAHQNLLDDALTIIKAEVVSADEVMRIGLSLPWLNN